MSIRLLGISSQWIKSFMTNASNTKTKLRQFRLEDLQVPERYKGKIVEKWLLYWKGLCIDYRDVVLDVGKNIKEKPTRAAIYGSIGAGGIYCAKHNPDQTDFRERMLHHIGDMVLVDESCHNRASAQHLRFLEKCSNEGILRRLNLGVLSLLWLDNFDRAAQLYKATCTYTQPDYLTFRDRIIDVGFVGKWWKLEEKMIDYDVNEDNL